MNRKQATATDPLEVSEPKSGPESNTMHIDVRVPPKVMRLTQHMHNLIYIRFFYEQLGQQPPVWIKRQLERVEADLLEEIDDEEGHGGAFHKGSRR